MGRRDEGEYIFRLGNRDKEQLPLGPLLAAMRTAVKMWKRWNWWEAWKVTDTPISCSASNNVPMCYLVIQWRFCSSAVLQQV